MIRFQIKKTSGLAFVFQVRMDWSRYIGFYHNHTACMYVTKHDDHFHNITYGRSQGPWARDRPWYPYYTKIIIKICYLVTSCLRLFSWQQHYYYVCLWLYVSILNQVPIKQELDRNSTGSQPEVDWKLTGSWLEVDRKTTESCQKLTI